MKTVLIVGGSSDIGLEIAKYFSNLKYNVVITYKKNDDIAGNFMLFKCDITKDEEINKVVKKCLDLFGNIDILINLACIYNDNSFLNKTKKEFMDVLEVNLVGTFLSCQCYSKYIDNGLIINMSSTDGIDTGSQYCLDYSASKAGIIALSKGIALGTTNKVLCICPNWIDSNSTSHIDLDYLNDELKRIGQSRLITMNEFIDSFDEILNGDYKSGDIYRIDIKDDKKWVEKI